MNIFCGTDLVTDNLEVNLQGDLMEEYFDETKLIFDLDKNPKAYNGGLTYEN